MLGIISSVCAIAQPAPFAGGEADSLIHLDEVVITRTRMENYAVGHYLQQVDSTASKYAVVTNAAELFRKFGFGHIRSYGVGGLTTPSFRGTGATHTAILWNGINIISPLNGQSDLSLVPVTFIDDVQLQSGGSATLYGSGAIGGTIQFNNKAIFKQGLNLSVTENAGSFNIFFNGLSASWSGKRWISSTKVFQTSAENNFSFTNRNINPVRQEKRQHNAVEQRGILQQEYFQIDKKNLLSFRLWLQDNHYQIPEPTTVAVPGVSTQRDKFIRSTIGWDHSYRNGHLFVQSALIHHVLDYRNPSISTIAISTFNSSINMIENTLNVGDHIEWTSGINVTHEAVEAEELKSNPNRLREALYSAVKYEKGKWRNVLSARWEMVRNRYSPLSPSLGVDYRASRVISIFGNASRNYRIPTFNDLYWIDATSKGNPDLQMETSWSEEAGFKLNSPIQLQAAVFSNQVDNMIYWTQSAGIWSPRNLKDAWTRGVETMGTARKQMGSVNGELTVRYSYTLATSEGQQLVFTPKHESGTTLRFNWKSFNLSASNNYVGRQYTDDSNNEYLALKAYNIANLWLSKDISLKQLTLSMMIEVNNLFDSEVYSRPGYPLPGRNFKAGLTIRFNKQFEYEN